MNMNRTKRNGIVVCDYAYIAYHNNVFPKVHLTILVHKRFDLQ